VEGEPSDFWRQGGAADAARPGVQGLYASWVNVYGRISGCAGCVLQKKRLALCILNGAQAYQNAGYSTMLLHLSFAQGKQVLFVTNNSMKSRKSFKKKFDDLNLPVALVGPRVWRWWV
jgi:hypothetical protein